MRDIGQQIRQIILQILGLDVAPLNTDNLFDDLGCDSLDQVMIIMNIEEKFGIEIGDNDCEKIKTVQDAIDYVKTRTPYERGN